MQQERGQAMLRAAGARRLTRTLSRCPTGAKIARRNALCTWDVKHIGHSDPADLFGGKTPDRAFWNAQIHATSANTDHLCWECAISALVFLYTGGV